MSDESVLSEPALVDWKLLEGEDPTSSHGDDAEHWVTVYAELAHSTGRMLRAAEQRAKARKLENGSNPSLDHRELKYIATRLRFFEERLRWWVDRGAELTRTNGSLQKAP
jgi:ribosomal protein S16